MTVVHGALLFTTGDQKRVYQPFDASVDTSRGARSVRKRGLAVACVLPPSGRVAVTRLIVVGIAGQSPREAKADLI
jgi:hypothetical protein